jgi:hypothetical protein
MIQYRPMFSVIAMLMFAAITPNLLQAQAASSSLSVLSEQAPTALVAFGPQVRQLGVTRAVAATAPALQLQRSHAGGRNVSLMLIGGATLVVGSLVGGDAGTIIMISGGAIGLTGLWRYLQ